MISTSLYFSPVGNILIAGRDGGLIGLWLEGQKYFFGSEKYELSEKNKILKNETPVIKQTKIWLDKYFAKEKPEIGELNLAPSGSEFRQRVWKILCEIPYGETVTYGYIAKRISFETGKRMSAQAVGGAVGHNMISIIIPCHRVVGANGNLTGYAGGIETKLKLLAHEGVDVSTFYLPKSGSAL